MLIIWAGLLAGAIHVISGPDHLLALAPYSFEAKDNRHWIGVKWGLGHGFGIAIMAFAVLGLKTRVDVSSLSGLAECFVGFLLVYIGIRALQTSRKLLIHDHAHEHDSIQETNGHTIFMHLGSTVHSQTTTHPLILTLPDGSVYSRGCWHWSCVRSCARAGAVTTDAALYLTAYIIASILAMMLCVGSLGMLANKVGLDSVPVLIKVAGATALTTGVIWLYTFRSACFELLGSRAK